MLSGQNYKKRCFLSFLKTQKMQKTLFLHFFENAKNAKNTVFCIFLKTQKMQKTLFLPIRKNDKKHHFWSATFGRTSHNPNRPTLSSASSTAVIELDWLMHCCFATHLSHESVLQEYNSVSQSPIVCQKFSSQNLIDHLSHHLRI